MSKEFLIAPDPKENRLTEVVEGLDHSGKRVSTSVTVERPLTLYLNSQEIVTMMTICDYPEYLALGYLLNQNMLGFDDDVSDVEYDEDQIQNVINIITEERFNYEWKIKNLYDEIEKLKLKINNNDKI